jgi:Rrf2 family protein
VRLEVTRKSDLAVRALRALDDAGRRVKGPELADVVQSTPGFVAQVLSPLVRAGWVRSDPGPTGGYALTADLADVSVLAVIEAIEGPTDVGRCVLADRPCSEVGPCALHTGWQRAREELLWELDATSLDEVAVDRRIDRPC